MADFQRASQARDLIADTARLNNRALSALVQLRQIRDVLTGRTAEDRNEILTAVADLGYDAAEIQAMLNAWEAVNIEAIAQGVAIVDAPRLA